MDTAKLKTSRPEQRIDFRRTQSPGRTLIETGFRCHGWQRDAE